MTRFFSRFIANRTTVRGKIIGLVLVITTIVVLVAGFATMSRDMRVYRESWAADLDALARIVALSSGPALAFDDRATAQRTLASLQARPDILTAGLYDRAGNLYSAFMRTGEGPPPPRLTLATGIHIQDESVELSSPVVHRGEQLGSIYLRAHYDVRGRIEAYVRIFSLVLLMSVGIAAVLSNMLQRAITKPLDSMAGVARKIVERRDYSLRVRETSRDEIGIVIDAFNGMLEEVQSRTRALESSNLALTEEIRIRQTAEQAVRSSEKLYRAIGESIDFGVWVSTEQGGHIYASDSFLRLTGKSLDQHAGFGWLDILHPDDRQATLEAWQECVRSGDTWYREMRVMGVDGRYHPVLSQGVPIKGDQGEITGWAGINLDISRLKLTEQALREADRRKDEFLATLAHELRNPLAPIRHAVKLLDSPKLEEKRRQWSRDVIARQVERMALLLDDLLDVSRITRGQLNLRKSTVELQSLVSAAIETARPLLDAHQHLLRTELPQESIWLHADALRLSQALSNLLTNAAKYTNDHGRILLRATLEPEGLVLSVEDNGIGLARENMPRLFEMFSQVHTSPGRAEGGLGIGLALVKGLVELHDGCVEAYSAGGGLGSRFTIRLPRAILAPPQIAREDGPLPGGGDNSCLRVLVADDNRDAADSLGMVLEMSGYGVCTVHTGLEAQSKAAEFKPHAMILDIGMPDVNGYDVARWIRSQSWGREVLLLAVTGWGQSSDKQKAKSAGFDVHLTKPVDPDALDRLLNEKLGAWRREASLTASLTAELPGGVPQA